LSSNASASSEARTVATAFPPRSRPSKARSPTADFGAGCLIRTVTLARCCLPPSTTSSPS
jgi:hypothetical protein